MQDKKKHSLCTERQNVAGIIGRNIFINVQCRICLLSDIFHSSRESFHSFGDTMKAMND